MLKPLALTAALLASTSLLPAHAETIFGMTQASNLSTAPGLTLVSFDSATPGSVTTVGSFSGVVAGQSLRSLDFRPATGQLYAISSNLTAAQLYTVNLSTAVLTPVGAGLTLTGNTSNRVEMDFNPVADRVRIITGGGVNNFRANPDTGLLAATDTTIAFVAGDVNAATNPPVILGAAYSNNVAGAATTTLYAWEYNTDALTTVGTLNGVVSPNTGQLNTAFLPAGVLTSSPTLGMDISGATGTLFVSHDDPATGLIMGLYTRSLSTGAETLIGNYGSGVFIGDISVQIAPIPEPAAWALWGAGLAAVAGRKLRKRTPAV